MRYPCPGTSPGKSWISRTLRSLAGRKSVESVPQIVARAQHLGAAAAGHEEPPGWHVPSGGFFVSRGGGPQMLRACYDLWHGFDTLSAGEGSERAGNPAFAWRSARARISHMVASPPG